MLGFGVWVHKGRKYRSLGLAQAHKRQGRNSVDVLSIQGLPKLLRLGRLGSWSTFISSVLPQYICLGKIEVESEDMNILEV